MANHGTTGTRCTRFGDGLTPKEQRFCEEYVKDFNATQAFLRTGFTEKYEVASTAGSSLLKKDYIRDYIDQLRTQMSEVCTTDRNDLMKFWTTVMFDVNESTANRLKASDYLGKVIGVFDRQSDQKVAPTIIVDLGLPPAPPELPVIESDVDLVPGEDYVLEETEDELDTE